MIEVIKEYLVSIGFKTDDKAYNEVQKSLGKLEQALGDFSKTVAGKFVIAGAAVEGFSLVASAAIGTFAVTMAKADQQVEIFARRMLTTEKNARSLKTVMSAMGLDSLEDLKDVALNPELRQQFLALRNVAAGLEPGQDVQNNLAQIRQLTYEWQKFQVLVTYGMQYIAGYTAKYLSGPLKQLMAFMQRINADGKTNLQRWADGIAKVFAGIVRIAGVGVRVIGMIDRVPGILKAVAAGVATVGLAIKAGPWGMITAAVSALMLLLDDYLTFKDGGKSAFGGFWKGSENLIQGIGEFLSPLTVMISHIDEAVSAIAAKMGVAGSKSYNALKGAALGAAGGAALGTVIPGVGTGIGAAVGGVIGGVAGWQQKIDPKKIEAGKKLLAKMQRGGGAALEYLLAVAKLEGLRVTSTTGGRHNKNSKHYRGEAIDIDHRGVTAEKLRRLRELYGIHVRDERTRPRGQRVWGGAHFHLETTQELARRYAGKLFAKGKPGPMHGVTAPPKIDIHINGAKDPTAVATEVAGRLESLLAIRHFQGAFA